MSKNCTIFISGINYKTKEEDLLTLFKQFGEIVKTKIPKYQDTNRLKGYCHITYKSEKSVKEALSLHKTTLDSRYLVVELAKGERAPELNSLETLKKKITPKTLTIFVKNLPYDITEDELGDFFVKCGKIKNVRFVYNSKFGHFKGFAYIDFEKNSSLFSAIKLNGELFKERRIVIDIDEGNMKNGFRFKMENQGNTKYNKEVLDIKNKKIRKEKKKNRVSKNTIKNLTTEKIDSTKKFIKKVDNLNIF